MKVLFSATCYKIVSKHKLWHPYLEYLKKVSAMKKTVQEYIDETPAWSDGTRFTRVPMTNMQWQIWSLATAGKFFEGLVVFMTGVSLPLMAMEFQLGDIQKGT